MTEGIERREAPITHTLVLYGGDGLREIAVRPTRKLPRALGEGTYGRVFAEEFSIQNSADHRWYRETLAVKHYTTRYTSDAPRAFEHYRMCRDAALPVPETFGVETGQPLTFATDLTQGGKYIVESYNSENNYDVTHGHLLGVSNISEIVRAFVDIARKAADAHIHLPMDGFFFIFPKHRRSQSVPVSVLLGDFDNIKPTQVKDTTNIFSTNFNDVVRAFARWLRRRAHEQGNDFDPEKIIQELRSTDEFKRASVLL